MFVSGFDYNTMRSVRAAKSGTPARPPPPTEAGCASMYDQRALMNAAPLGGGYHMSQLLRVESVL